MGDAGTEQPAQVENLRAFRRLVTDSFVPLELSADAGRPFAARLHSAGADDVVFTEVRAKPHLVERTPETIARGGSGYYKLSLLLSGTSILVQDGRELVMRPGDLSVYDTSRPYSLLFDDEFQNLIMMFPKDRLELPALLTEQLTAVSLSQQHPALASLITAVLSQFPEQLASLDAGLRSKLAHTSLDLTGTLFSAVLDADPQQRDPHQRLLQRIFGYIDERLASPELSPGTIAAAHYISTRQLHALFHEAGTTVSTRIRERRLERCRADLLDPSLSGRPVSAVAARWGFPDAAHFSRAFKASYGVSPSSLRAG